MTSTAFLLTPEMLVNELSREARTERMEQRVKPSIKQAIEFAAALAGTDTSEFVSTAAFQAAMDRIASTRRAQIAGEDAVRFFSALDRNAEPNVAMRELMAAYDQSPIDDAV